jgi:signal transduction histidine kinase
LYSVNLSHEDQGALGLGDPVIRYFADYPLDALFNDFALVNFDKVPLVEVVAPLIDQEETLIAAIQYWSDGTDVAEEFHNLDQYLATMGTLLISGGVIIFSILFLFARRRLVQMAALLAERNLSLEKANADLTMAARTSAIGSVASHLFHGLKNPLAGLKTYLKVTGRDEEAVAMTDRMQGLIDESLSVIRDQDFAAEAYFSIEELREVCWKRLQDLTTKGGKELVVNTSGLGQLDGRQVQLLLLVIRNLVENAIDASPDDGIVQIDLQQEDDIFTVEVSDSGPGLPESIKSRLFEPSQSTKSGGTGIGLAISSVIARHIPASLELKSSNQDGTIFAIRMSNKR